jgi:NAD dependent epimerase/dehydratase family enzyme
MNIIIVGGTGTIGKAICRELEQRHKIITVLKQCQLMMWPWRIAKVWKGRKMGLFIRWGSLSH